MSWQDDEKHVETVEVVGTYTRKCHRCKRTCRAKATGFRWCADKKIYAPTEWEMPKGWLSIAHTVDGGMRETATTHFIPICVECAPEVLTFVKWWGEKP